MKITSLFRHHKATPEEATSTDTGIKLHLGCGNKNYPGFINVDIQAARHIHHVQRIDKLPNFANNSVQFIYASHCLEHFPIRKVPHVLAEWARILSPGGTLAVSVPDFDAMVTIYTQSGKDIMSIIWPLMGGQVNDYDFHQTVFTDKSLRDLMHNAGLQVTGTWTKENPLFKEIDDWSCFEVSCEPNAKIPISLNIIAQK